MAFAPRGHRRAACKSCGRFRDSVVEESGFCSVAATSRGADLGLLHQTAEVCRAAGVRREVSSLEIIVTSSVAINKSNEEVQDRSHGTTCANCMEVLVVVEADVT